MQQGLQYWYDLYHKLKFEAICLDIEVAYSSGPISVAGLYRPKDGEIEVEQLVLGKNLSAENLKAALADCKLFITFNGRSWDIPKIRQDFPGVLPGKFQILDLYLVARRLGLDTNLKVLEKTLRIERLLDFTQKRYIATKLWARFEKYNDLKALDTLLEYNKQDTANLYPLAELLMQKAENS